MADLAVVLVTWNVRDLALHALESLYHDLSAHGPQSTDVYVVDNASADGTANAFPQVKLTASRENVGFGAANNLALRHIGFGSLPSDQLPQAVYLLNPDTITQPGATGTLYDAIKSDPSLGLAGARLTYEDGSFQHSAFHFPGLWQIWVEFFPIPGRFYESHFNGRYPRERYESSQPFAIDFTLGATMMLRREVVEQTGMFDEQFFMYCEEIDWAWRIHKAGWQVKCVPMARVIHLEAKSTGQARPQSLINLWRSRLRLYRKHAPAWKLALARRLIVQGMQRKARQIEADESLTLDQKAALWDACRTIRMMVLEDEA
jgi:GT2 family glycosyltransferase